MRSIHTVIVTPDWCQAVGAKYDPAKFIENCRRSGVADIEFYTKNALGDAFFPYRGRSPARDWVTETRQLARNANITFRAYHNVGLDGRLAIERPEWVCRNAAGNPMAYANETKWMWLCIRSPWGHQVVDELRQVQQAIKPDGIWLDLFGGPGSYSHVEFDVEKACHCKYCCAAYRERTGDDMPSESSDPGVRRTVFEVAQEARVRLIREVVNSLRALDPKISISYNHAGDFWDRMGVADKDRDFQDGVDLYALEA